MKRNTDLSFRKSESTSVARIRGFNPESTKRFFDILGGVIDKFEKRRIFNVDETGLSVVQSKNPEVIRLKGKKQIGVLSSTERGSLITMLCCMNATGIFIPPLIVFPSKKIPLAFKDGAVDGTEFR